MTDEKHFLVAMDPNRNLRGLKPVRHPDDERPGFLRRAGSSDFYLPWQQFEQFLKIGPKNEALRAVLRPAKIFYD